MQVKAQARFDSGNWFMRPPTKANVNFPYSNIILTWKPWKRSQSMDVSLKFQLVYLIIYLVLKSSVFTNSAMKKKREETNYKGAQGIASFKTRETSL